MRRIRAYISGYRRHIFILTGYLIYLTVLPAAVKWFTPCMNFRFNSSYTYAQCSSTLILDRFVKLALAGFALSVFTAFILRSRKRMLPVAVFAVLAAGITVAAYYLFIPTAEAAAASAPILLESLLGD